MDAYSLLAATSRHWLQALQSKSISALTKINVGYRAISSRHSFDEIISDFVQGRTLVN